MEEKVFVWTTELILRMLQLRHENDCLFKEKKQPWKQFRKILLEHGFPEEMSINHLRKKWSYMYDMYKLAKKSRNKAWQYYKQFEKIFGKTKVLDKYESWSDEWRLKLITCISEAMALKLDFRNMWRTVEEAMRCQDLPENCCIQDIKGLWHHLIITFKRKHRIKQKKGTSDWPLYDVMFEYFQEYDPKLLIRLDTEAVDVHQRTKNYNTKPKDVEVKEDEEIPEFQWTKDITESFIQIRLQHDWLFREKKWAWNNLLAIMQDDYGFPQYLNGREICRKWAATFSEFQKAVATNNKSWLYYNLFELYLGEGVLSLNPMIGWQEEWVSNLISARINLDHLFKLDAKDPTKPWREVEKRLRRIGLPLDHSLLDLPEIWTHLLKTYRWKKKFATKGILTEQWPYFEAMAQYDEIKDRPIKKQKMETSDHYDDDDYEDDMKLFDLKQKLEGEVKPKFEYLEANQCRSCSNEEGCVNIFDHVDGDGVSLAQKLKTIGDIDVDPSDNLPSQICLNCLGELENAYKFRRKCQEVDKEYRNVTHKPQIIKIEHQIEDEKVIRNENCNNIDNDEDTDMPFDGEFHDPEPLLPKIRVEKKPLKKQAPKVLRKKKRMRKEKYIYFKVCDICGKHTKNLKAHLDSHATVKSYSCDICDKKFKFKSGLILHKAKHEPTPRKKCEVCGKTFHILAQYRRHFVYHANERKFECETCGKRFNTLDILRVHNRTHTDERPFSCPECGKTFRTAGCVSRHKRIVHRTTKIQ